MKTILWLVPVSSPRTGECEWHNYMNSAGWPIVYCVVEPNTLAAESSVKKIKEAKPDMIFATSDSVIEAGLQLKAELKIPLAIYVWGYLPEREHSWQHSEWLMRKADKIRQADLVFGCSYYTSRQLGRLGIPNTTLYPGINSDLIESLLLKEKKENKPQILAIARLVEHKRLDMIITAIGCLPKPRPKLLFLGWGPEFNFLRRIAVRLNIDVEVRQQINDEEKFLELLSPDTLCLVTASAYEGFGLVPVEAMYCNKRVIASDIPAHREILTNHPKYFSGLNELVARLQEVIDSPADPEKLKENHEYVYHHFTCVTSVQNLAIKFRKELL